VNEQETAVAVEAWVNEVLPELKASYPHVTASKGDLPDTMVDVRQKSITLGGEDNRFPWGALQQRMLRVFSITVSFLVDTTEEDGDAEETAELRDFGDRLEASLLNDATLGDRVEMASPFCTFDYALPFVGYPDGTRGRQMTLDMATAELVDYEE
jgi:hypothetical protein